MPLGRERVEAVRNYRLTSKRKSTLKLAQTPTRFQVENFPVGNYLAIPEVSSGERRYIPIGFLNDSAICSDKIRIVPAAQLYHFGILTSSIHMAWMRAVGMYLGTSYSYSNNIVYNNFVWCEATTRQRRQIERSAQEILNVRASFQVDRLEGVQVDSDKNSTHLPTYSSANLTWTLAKLYNEDTMPDELRAAYKWNDYNVALAYGFENFWEDEARVVAELMKLYKSLTS